MCIVRACLRSGCGVAVVVDGSMTVNLGMIPSLRMLRRGLIVPCGIGVASGVGRARIADSMTTASSSKRLGTSRPRPASDLG
jgi:hypothetical protein